MRQLGGEIVNGDVVRREVSVNVRTRSVLSEEMLSEIDALSVADFKQLPLN
jgi:hypothetical protein